MSPASSRAAPAARALYASVIIYTICVYGTMAMMSVAAGLVFAAWIADALTGGQTQMSRFGSGFRADFRVIWDSPAFWPTAWLGFACLWSLAWAKWSGLEFFGHSPHVTWDDTRKAWHLAFNFVLFVAFSRLDDHRLARVSKVWVALGLASGVLAVVQHYVPVYEPMQLPHTMRPEWSPPPGWLGLLSGKYHATGFAGFHLSFSAIIGFPTAVFMALFAVLLRREGLSRRTWLVGLGLLVLAVANVLTFSKTAWAAVPLTALLITLTGLRGVKRHVRIGIVCAVAAAALAWGLSPVVRDRFADNKARSLVEREMVWTANLEMIRQFPIFGVGWHRNSELAIGYYDSLHQVMVPFESHAHNNILDQWSTTGLFGLLPFLWLNGVLVLLSRRVYLTRPELLWRVLGLGFVGGWFCLHINGLTQVNWWDAKVLHQISWVTALTLELDRRKLRTRV